MTSTSRAARVSTPLWDHQRRGLDLIASRRATLLAWEMGTGKTLPVVAYVVAQRPALTLIVCPKSVVSVWPREFQKHAPECDVTVWHDQRGSVARRLERLEHVIDSSLPIVVVVNYEAVWRDPMGAAFLKLPWDLVVADEIHRIKAPGGKQSRYLGRLAGYLRRTRPTAKLIGLTGTPMPHSPLDAYAQFRFLDPTIYGVSFVRFRAQYAIMGGHMVNGRPVQVIAYKDLDDLHERFYTIADRVTKDEVLDLPDQVHVSRVVELPPAARTVYEQIEKDMIAQIKQGTVTAANALVKVVRLQQITAGHTKTEDGIERHLHDVKAAALADILDDLDPKAPVAVFCKFRRSLDCVRRVTEACERPINELSGRENTVGSLWDPEPGAVAAIQIQAGGVGIDLTACSTVVYYDQTHSLGDFDQSLSRVHRPGQTQKVTYLHLLARDTIDFAIRAALKRRKNVIEAVLQGLRI